MSNMEIIFISNYKVKGVINGTVKECYNYLKEQKEIGIDIETTRAFSLGMYPDTDPKLHPYRAGLDPYLSKVIMLQLGTLDKIFVIDTRTEDISLLIPLFDSKDRIWVGQNLKFEAKHLRHNYGINFHKIWDVMLVEQNLTNGLALGYSLAKIAERYLGIKNINEIDLFNQEEDEDEVIDKSIRLEFLTIGDKPFTLEQITYGAGDIEYPLRIKKIQEKGRDGYNPVEVHKLENDFCPVLADIELNGMSFNKEQWLTVYQNNIPIYNKRLNKLNSWVEQKHPKFSKPATLFEKAEGCKILWSSPAQVIEFLRYLKICPKEKSKQTKKVEWTAGAKALTKLLDSEYKEKYKKEEETEIIEIKDFILNFLLLGKSAQAITTFGEDWLKYIHPITGRVHTSFKQILNTGRISSSNPNIQNIPSNIEYRKAFIPSKGNKLVNADYASQEARVLADVSKDPDMLSFFNDGHPIFKADFHSFVGTKMFRIIRNEPDLIISSKTHPKERQDAKAIGFKISYGGSAYTLKDDFGVIEEVAKEFIDGFFQAFPTLADNFEQAKIKAIKLGYIEIDSLTQRRWFDKNFNKMQELNKKAWDCYPKDYSKLSIDAKNKVKEKLKIEHPELKDLWSEYFSLRGKLERNALNYRIQGRAGSQTKKAGVLFRQKQLENNLQNKTWLVSMIHDEALIETTLEYAEEAKLLLEQSMIIGAQTYCEAVKMEAEGFIVDYWHHS